MILAIVLVVAAVIHVVQIKLLIGLLRDHGIEIKAKGRSKD